MRGSLGRTSSSFTGLTAHQALALLRVLEEQELRTKARIRAVFSEQAQGFAPTLDFLARIGVVQSRAGVLRLRAVPPSADVGIQRKWLLSRLVTTASRYRVDMYRYLSGFRIVDGCLIRRESVHHRSRQSDVRNFLMELAVIGHDASADQHFIANEYVLLYAAARDTSCPLPPASLARSATARDELGLSAELTIMEFEKHRIGQVLASELDHVSLRNAAAGYDIRSLTVREDGSREPRFIEVKAVPAASMGFFWSRNEMSFAEAFGGMYYLYLLPVAKGGAFDVNSLMAIPNPCARVLVANSDWAVESDGVHCTLPCAGNGSDDGEGA